jgi:hypothetical protein
MQGNESGNSQDPNQNLPKGISASDGTISGTILWVNDPPPPEEEIETTDEIQIIGNKVMIVDNFVDESTIID